jgi:hypothetical protein
VHRHAAELRILGAYPRADGAANAALPTDSAEAYTDAALWFGRLTQDIDEV